MKTGFISILCLVLCLTGCANPVSVQVQATETGTVVPSTAVSTETAPSPTQPPTAQNQIPPACEGANLVFDSQLGKMLLVNCYPAGGAADLSITIWGWDWDADAWQVLDDQGPPGRVSGGAAYDTVRQQLILYGGFGSNRKGLEDTWVWDGEQWLCLAGCQ